MNVFLRVLQIVLALKFVTVTFTHSLRPDETKMEPGTGRLGRLAQPVLHLTALCSFVGAVALVLPGATGVLVWLTPWSAALLALMMLVGVGFHLVCRENPNVVAGLVMCALAAFVAYGRWVVVPF
ncbi:MAG: hypothetical protein GY832_47350 [Chloroflexi bacterium]|nr:hypothetical protein [Chloroflexota bacterium]